MIKLISGSMGSGKTKRLVEYANEIAQKAKGNLIFIDDDKRQMYELKRNIRFICIEDFLINNSEQFLGFLSGINSNDYDLEYIFIDGICKIMNCENNSIVEIVKKFENISNRFDVNIISTISVDKLPDELLRYEI